VTKQCNFT